MALIVSGALCAGLVVGAGFVLVGVQSDATESDEYTALQSDYTTLQGERGVLQGENEKLKSDLEVADAAVKNAEDNQTDAEHALNNGETGVQATQDALREERRKLDAFSDRLDAQQDALDKAEKDAAQAEQAGTIPGTGLYSVGEDVEAGQYASSGQAGCYYAIRTAIGAGDVLDSEFEDGPAIVTLAAGRAFKTVGCADWVKV